MTKTTPKMAGISISNGLNFKKSSRGDTLEPSSVRYSRHRIAASFEKPPTPNSIGNPVMFDSQEINTAKYP